MPSRKRVRLRPWVSLLALLIALQSATPAWAWGRLGHRVIAKLAERHLTDQAEGRDQGPARTGGVAGRLLDMGRRSTAGKMPKTAPWHYVDVPLDEPRYDDRSPGTTRRRGYIVPKIRELRVTLKDRSKPVEERRAALRFLVHLVEDLHMPLHVGENHDKGGNNLQVRWFDRGSNLHRVWDTGIIDAGRAE